METRLVAHLTPHPQNAAIYGDHADTELIESVRQHGVLMPLLVTQAGVVISGHRRLDAARKVGLIAVPVLYFDGDELAILRALVESNRNRIKTNEQMAREFETLLKVEAGEAARRQRELAGTRPNTLPDLGSNLTQGTGRAKDKAAAAVGTSRNTATKAVEVVKAIDHLEANGQKREAAVLRSTLNKSVGRAHYDARESGHITPQVQAVVAPIEPETPYVTLDAWNRLDDVGRAVVMGRPADPKFHFNNQRNDNIEWARWSWNPITGCKHDCSYCYARDIAMRLYPQKFEPTFLPGRLGGPANTPLPLEATTDIGYKNVFTCSMADLFGKWVPNAWIEAVLKTVWDNPQWNFLFLTKFPIRLAEFEFPANAWLGTSIDAQARIPNAEKAFARIKGGIKWLSCEPMLERLTFARLELFDWVVVGGASSSTQTPEFHPPREWVEHIERQAHSAGCRVYEKTNLLERICDYPGQQESLAVSVPDAFKMGYLQRDVKEAVL